MHPRFPRRLLDAPRRSQEAPKTPPRRPQDRLKTLLRRPKAARRPQDAPETPQDAPKTPQEVPRSRPRRTKIHPKSILMLKTSKIKNTLKINEKSTKTHHGEASAASEASGASRSLRQALRSKNVPRDLCRKAKRAGGNQKEIGASRSISNQVYVGGGFSNQNGPKSHPRRTQYAPRRA